MKERLLGSADEATISVATAERPFSSRRDHPLLMSDPSRTADIERVLTIGVHGPRALAIVILGNG
jgi:L-lactate utilization protein LutC